MRHISELRQKAKRRGPTPETRLKKACTQFMKIHGIFSYAVTQGLGCYPGLPDRMAHFQGEVYYLEFKTPKGRLSDKQLKFQRQCQLDDVHYHVIRSVDDLIRVFEIPSLF